LAALSASVALSTLTVFTAATPESSRPLALAATSALVALFTLIPCTCVIPVASRLEATSACSASLAGVVPSSNLPTRALKAVKALVSSEMY